MARWFKVLVILVVVACSLISGFIGAATVLFTGKAILLLPIGLATLSFPLLVAAGLFNWLSRPIRWSIAAVLVLSFAALGTQFAYEAYDNSFEKLSDEVDLWQYLPDVPQSKIALLEAPSTLRLKENLPRLDGATALYPLYSAFVQATYPGGRYFPNEEQVSCSKTIQAYEQLIAGKTDMIFVAQPSQKQLDEARSKGVEFTLTPIGREAFVFFVNAKNPVKGLSVEQIQNIYSGKITDWQTVGGESREITAYQRPEGSGSQTLLQKIMQGKPLIAPIQAQVVEGMGGIIKQTADYKNYRAALGYSFLFFTTGMVNNHQIKLLEINGIAPTQKSILDKSYPFVTEIYAVTVKGRETPQTHALSEWILSPQGQELVEKTGYVPIH